MTRQTLKSFIAQGKIDLFFKEAQALPLPDNEWHDQLFLIKARYQELRQMQLTGTLSTADHLLEMNRIKMACLDLLNQLQLEEGEPIQATTPVTDLPTLTRRRARAWYVWAVPMLVLVGALVMWQFNLNNNSKIADYNQDKVKDSIVIDTPPPIPSVHRDTNEKKPLVNNPTPASIKPTVKKRGIALKITGNAGAYRSQANAAIRQALQAANIKTENYVTNNTYASIVDVEVTVRNEKDRIAGEVEGFSITVMVVIDIANGSGADCFSRTFTAKQFIEEAQNEADTVAKCLANIQQQIADAAPYTCPES